MMMKAIDVARTTAKLDMDIFPHNMKIIANIRQLKAHVGKLN